jgi:membrane protein
MNRTETSPHRGTGQAARSRPQNELGGLWSRTKLVWRRFSDDQGPVLAAGLTFFTLLSIVPLLLVALAVLGFVMDSPHQAILKMQDVVAHMLPGPAGVQAFRQIAQQIDLEKTLAGLMNSRGIARYTGGLSLLWAALQIFVNATTQMNAAFDVKESRSWVRLRLNALLVLVVASVLFIASLLPSSGPDFVRNLHISWLNLPSPVPWWVDLLFSLVAVAINIGMFAVIYRFLPAARVSWRVALFGGTVVGILWEVAKKAFTVYLAHSKGYGQLYGAMGGVILLITWLYYSNFIMLLGAEIASVYRMVRDGAAVSDPMEAQREEVSAVYEGRAVPLASGPHGDADDGSAEPGEPRKRAGEALGAIREDVRAAGEAVRRAAREIHDGADSP